MRSKNALSVCFLVCSAFCLSVGSIVTKTLLTDVPPLPFLVIQLLASISFLWAVAFIQRLRLAQGAPSKPLILVGTVIGTGSVCTILALNYTTASKASLIFATQPILIMGFAWMILSEHPRYRYVVLGFIALAGVAATVGGASSSGYNQSLLGDFFALLSTACAALYVVWMRKIMSTQHPLVALAVVQTAALMIAVLVWYVAEVVSPQAGSSVSTFQWAAAAVTGMIYYGIAFWIYLLGLQNVPANQAGLYLNLVPVFTIALAFVTLGETLTIQQWIGAVVVLGAVFAVSLLIARDALASDPMS